LHVQKAGAEVEVLSSPAAAEECMKDRLFLLRPGFYNVGIGPLYCTESLPVEGMLSFFPEIRTLIEVQYLEFGRPREPLVQLLGKENQSVPVLILTPRRRVRAEAPEPRLIRDQRVYTDEQQIRGYLSVQYRLPQAG
jgi:hypothetical protein